MRLFLAMDAAVFVLHCLLSCGVWWVDAETSRFLLSFPQHNERSAYHEVTVTSSAQWTPVRVEVLGAEFVRRRFMSPRRAWTIRLPPTVGVASTGGGEASSLHRHAHLLCVTSPQPVRVLASFCTRGRCVHSAVPDVLTWGTLYYALTPDLTATPDLPVGAGLIGSLVISSSDEDTSVDVILSGDVLVGDRRHPAGSVLSLSLAARQSVQLRGAAGSSLSGSEVHSQNAVGVLAAYACDRPAIGRCPHGFTALAPVSQWGHNYVVPSSASSSSSDVLLAMSAVSTSLQISVGDGEETRRLSLLGGVVKSIPVQSSQQMHVTGTSPLQLVYYRPDDVRSWRRSFVVALRSQEDLCQDEEDVLDGSGSYPTPPQTDWSLFLSTLGRHSSPALCDQLPSSCAEFRCGAGRKCEMRNLRPVCRRAKSKLCSAWGDRYHRTFDGEVFILEGDCNYTLVKNTCPDTLKGVVPVQIAVHRAYDRDAKTASIHAVLVSIHGHNISLSKGDKHTVWIDGQERELPFTLGRSGGGRAAAVRLHPSGSGVVLDTDAGLSLRYDWLHLLQVAVEPRLYGTLCGLCGNANDLADDDFIASDTTSAPGRLSRQRDTNPWGRTLQTLDPWGRTQQTQNQKPWLTLQNQPPQAQSQSQWVPPSSQSQTFQLVPSSSQSQSQWVPSSQSQSQLVPSSSQSQSQLVPSSSQSQSQLVPSSSQSQNQWVPSSQSQSQWVPSSQSQSQWVPSSQSQSQLVPSSSQSQSQWVPSSSQSQSQLVPPSSQSQSQWVPSSSQSQSQLVPSSSQSQSQLVPSSSQSQSQLVPSSQSQNQWVPSSQSQSQLVPPSSQSQSQWVPSSQSQSQWVPSSQNRNQWMPSQTQSQSLLSRTRNQNNKDFLLRWRVTGGGVCSEPCAGSESCFTCSRTATTTAAAMPDSSPGATADCGVLENGGGPLAECHARVGAWPFISHCRCVADKEEACRVISAYASLCQSLGVPLKYWRRSARCAMMTCPLNSHYETCGTACPATCATPHAPLSCPLPCAESCQCNVGYLLSAGTCVPATECGCVHRGAYHLPAEPFWVGVSCSMRCVCAAGGRADCTISVCPEGTRCAVQDGRRACHPLHPTPHRVTCTLMGGRRLTTYEGRSLDVHLGGCRYVLSQGCGGGQQGEESDNDAVAVHIQRGAVFLQLQDLNVTLEEQCRVTINNSTLKFPVRLERVSVYGSCLVTRVVLASGVLITYGGPELLRVTLPSPQRRTQCGLCAHRLPGAANLTQGTTHATSNDKDLYQAGVEDNLEDVSSWSVSGSNCSSRVKRNCPDGGSGCSNRGCNATRVARFRSAELCGALSRPTGPFADCHGVVDPRPFLEDCVKHLCRQDATAPKEAELICGALRAYAFVCQEEAAELRPWRGDACSISCPANSHYSVCASSCPESCASVGTAGTVCPWPCVEGCQCDPGFVQSSGGCVKPHDCGCMCKGRYYEEGETMDGCSVPCNNTDAATWLCCEAAPCPEGMNCTSMSSVKGERTQSLRPPSPATNQEARPLCTLGGNASHVSAFDGREHRLRGRCRYRLLGACGGGGPRQGGPPFPVEVDAQADAQSVLSVWVKLNGSLLEMTSNNTYTVQVNGVNSILPYVLSPSVTVNSTSASTYVHDAELGFMLSLAKDGRLSIHLSGELVNTTCGLCSDPTAQEAWWSNGDPWCTNDVSCPANSHYESCGSTCPPSCVPSGNGTSCDVSPQCVPGCVCDRGLVSSPEGCVRPEHCGCTDPSGRYHPNGAPFYIPEDCGQLCHCPLGGGGQALCASQICPRGQVCKRLAAGGERRCRPGQPLNCTYVNGLHLGTFDGRRLAFRDACAAYALVASGTDGAGSSSSAAELTAFNVTISDASCAKRFSHSLELTLWLGGTRVLVGKHHPDKILVDGLLVQLPFHHPSGLVEAQRGPSSLLIRTHFGLRLSVYTTGTVLVELPDMYRSSVSGLCGNANGDPLDDYLTLGGELVANVSQFARSWRSGGAEEEACASTDCVSAQRNCSEEQLEFFRGEDFCGVLLNPLGPFEECVSVLGPRHYVEVCAQDCCRYDGHHAALCSSIAAYAAACQAAQLMVRHWRSETFCAMSCPMNSHYELRGSDCRPACGGVSDDQSAACSGRSQEGCQCDEGFLLSDGHCVAPWDCGCLYHGQYYPAGVFYPGHSCHECRCLGGVVDCSAAPCGDQESCTVVDGVARCRPLELGVCQVFGGFAYLTFDGRALAFRGAPCTYVLSQRSSTGQSVEDSGHTGQSEEDSGYTVLVSFQTDGNWTRRAISRLELRLHSLNLTLDPQTPWKIQVNMEDRMLPLDVGPIRAFSSGHSVFISSVHQSGVSLQLSANQYVRLSVPSARDGEPSGLCGDFSGEPSDDLRLRSGRLTDDPAEFQRSWVVAGGPRDSAQQCNASYSGAASTAPPEAVAGCDALVARSEPFQGCWDEGRGAEEADLYREACLEALHSGASVSEAVCLALEGYATACREAGFTVGAWRHNTTCSLQCPVEGSSARRCVDPAVSSCPALLQPGSAAPSGRGQAATMGRVCYEGCQCDGDDSLMDGDACVAMRECGCFHQGRYIKADEELLTERCAQRCRCHPLGGAVCQAAPCRPWEQCALLDSAWACRPGPQPPACRLRGGLHITTPTGHTVALGDSQVYPYNVVSLCDRTSQNWFRVVSFHGRCDNGTTPRTVDVLQVLFHGRVSVTIQEGAVKVKGHRVPLPHTLPSVGVSLSVGDTLDTVVLRRGVASPGTEAWLEVEAGLSGEATVRLAAAGRMGPLCGLCGDVGHTPFPSRQPITSWLLPDVPACGFNQ